eukprot:Hpha_TRINITY_DN11438_c0_g1::TRINITY_DN11438_c0_g1_i1::g.137529::m.137529
MRQQVVAVVTILVGGSLLLIRYGLSETDAKGEGSGGSKGERGSAPPPPPPDPPPRFNRTFTTPSSSERREEAAASAARIRDEPLVNVEAPGDVVFVDVEGDKSRLTVAGRRRLEWWLTGSNNATFKVGEVTKLVWSDGVLRVPRHPRLLAQIKGFDVAETTQFLISVQALAKFCSVDFEALPTALGAAARWVPATPPPPPPVLDFVLPKVGGGGKRKRR